MNSATGASAAVVGPHRREGPLRSRPYTVVGELPAAMAVPGGRGAGYWPVVQLIKDWNNRPEYRELMLAGGLPEDVRAVTAAKIAAVVHGLCPRDGHPLPEWVLSARSPVGVALVPVRADHGGSIYRRAATQQEPSCGQRPGFSSGLLVNLSRDSGTACGHRSHSGEGRPPAAYSGPWRMTSPTSAHASRNPLARAKRQPPARRRARRRPTLPAVRSTTASRCLNKLLPFAARVI